MKQAITIHETDDVAVALQDLKQGQQVLVNDLLYDLIDCVKAKHKFALKDFDVGENIHMYNLLIGEASQPIKKGEAITIDNIIHKAAHFNLSNEKRYQWTPPDISKWKSKTFNGFHRQNGEVGTANYWIVFPLVFCENRNIETLKTAFERGLGMEKPVQYENLIKELIGERSSTSSERSTNHFYRHVPHFPNVTGIRFITHQGGCGGTRDDAMVLMKLLTGYVRNPNVAGATVLSLGCQNAQVEEFRQILNVEGVNKPVHVIDQQESGKESDLIRKAIELTIEGLSFANKSERKPAPLDKLSIGLECGGSDGFSGISANPTLGHVSDLIAALGGKAILSEFPELCGVEQELIDRTKDTQKAEKFIRLMRSYNSAAEAVGSGFDMNPSPGNIKDGLITDAIKSAGAARKGGTSPVEDVLDYTEYAESKGLNLLCTPGNDVESTTGLAGSGANIILFTTGLGTPTGNPITPVIKVSSNSSIATRMEDIIDIDTGPVIAGEKSIEKMAEEMLNHIIQIASGKPTKAMLLEQYDFIPWKRGISL